MRNDGAMAQPGALPDGAQGESAGHDVQNPEAGAEGREKRGRDGRGRGRGPRGDRPERGERADRPERGEREARATMDGAPIAPDLFSAMSAEPESIEARADHEPAVAAAPVPMAAAVQEQRTAPSAAAPNPVRLIAAPLLASPGLPKVQVFELPVSELADVAHGSGLEWVNSDAHKVAAAQAAMAAEPRPIHVPRQRPLPEPVDESPLILVETRRDLRELKLPFEDTAPQA